MGEAVVAAIAAVVVGLVARPWGRSKPKKVARLVEWRAVVGDAKVAEVVDREIERRIAETLLEAAQPRERILKFLERFTLATLGFFLVYVAILLLVERDVEWDGSAWRPILAGALVTVVIHVLPLLWVRKNGAEVAALKTLHKKAVERLNAAVEDLPREGVSTPRDISAVKSDPRSWLERARSRQNLG